MNKSTLKDWLNKNYYLKEETDSFCIYTRGYRTVTVYESSDIIRVQFCSLIDYMERHVPVENFTLTDRGIIKYEYGDMEVRYL